MGLIIDSIVCWGFSLGLSLYLITNLQWYNYSFYRIFTKHHKLSWHFYYFFLPLLLFVIAASGYSKIGFYIFGILCFGCYIPFLLLWHLQLDKRLVFTRRVISFFIILLFLLSLHQIVFSLGHFIPLSFLIPVGLSFILSALYERLLFSRYLALAKSKIRSSKDLKIISITGSFGKTSMKNFLDQILRTQFNVYATPRSVNTIKGIVGDINENLDSQTQIYITEAGARQKGDIKQIANLLDPQYIIIGEIGPQHIEYFKTLDNIAKTKFELLESKRLQKALIHQGSELIYQDDALPPHITRDKIILYPGNLQNIHTTLEKTSFDLEIKKEFVHFETNILGTFNVSNLAAAILMASHLGVNIEKIQRCVANMEPIAHRLQKSIVGGKIILDDSFNGNLAGMKEAIRIAGLHTGKKVIITPGLIESDIPSNIELAKAIDEVFDLAIITGELNSKLLSEYIKRPQKIILKNKSQLESILLTSTYKGDLLLFANDAPNFI